MRGLGYLVDRVDERDQKLSTRLGALAPFSAPVAASVEHPVVLPKDQELSSSCTGQAISQGSRLAYLFQGVACPDLSALDPYYRGRAEYGGESSDDGSYLRTVIKAVVRGGIADEAAWPFSMANVNRNPNMRARQSAFDRKGVRGYHRIDSGDVEGVRKAIAAGFPVVGGWMVDEAFLNWNGQSVISGQTRPVGGHAMCITSYSEGTFRLLNSWGRGWGRGGYAVVDEVFIGAVQDAWALEV